MKKYLFLLLVAGATIFSSCTKEENNLKDKTETQNETSLSEDAILRKNVALVTLSTANDNAVINEVFNTIKNRIIGDEAVLYADLIDNDKSLLKSAEVSNFRSKFLEALSSQNLKSASINNYNDILEKLKNGKIQLYWPYSENWDGKTLPTVTFNDGINLEENIGWLPDGTEILVNEEYALKNPVWIINTMEFEGDLNQVREKIKQVQQIKNESISKSANYMATGISKEYLAVKMAKIRCTSQTDPFYDGGPEIRIVRAGLIDEWHANTSDWLMAKNFTRSQARNNDWLDFNNTWDTRWGANDIEQVIGCFDYDGMGDWKVWIKAHIFATYTYDKNGVATKDTVDTGFEKNYDGDEEALYSNSWGDMEWARTALSGNNIESLGIVDIEWTNTSYWSSN